MNLPAIKHGSGNELVTTLPGFRSFSIPVLPQSFFQGPQQRRYRPGYNEQAVRHTHVPPRHIFSCSSIDGLSSCKIILFSMSINLPCGCMSLGNSLRNREYPKTAWRKRYRRAVRDLFHAATARDRLTNCICCAVNSVYLLSII